MRNAYISLGIYGSAISPLDGGPTAGGVDMGIGNTGDGWHPVMLDTIPYAKVGEQELTYGTHYGTEYAKAHKNEPAYTAPSDATNAIIIVKPINESTVEMSVQFKRGNTNVGNTFKKQLKVVTRTAWNRYYRFASLVPLTRSMDLSDSTYMLGTQFTNLGIHNGSAYERWGSVKESPLCVSAWAMHFPKCQLSKQSVLGEEIRIDHWA